MAIFAYFWKHVTTYLGMIYNRHRVTATIRQTLGTMTGAMGCESCDDRQKEAKIGRRTKGREAFSRMVVRTAIALCAVADAG